MVVLTTQSEFGHAPPPQTPYSIVSNIPLWENSQKLLEGDASIIARLKHIYPRFGPTQYVAQVRSYLSAPSICPTVAPYPTDYYCSSARKSLSAWVSRAKAPLSTSTQTCGPTRCAMPLLAPTARTVFSSPMT